MDNNSVADEEKQALLRFLTNIECLTPINEHAGKFNVFDVFGFSRNEIRHSYFLRWLLDPNESHYLDDKFIKSLIACLVSLEPERYGNLAFRLLMLDCSDFMVQREKNNIDLFLLSKSNSVAITIENKIGSHEHASKGFDSQLDKYRSFVETEYSGIETRLYVYLSPQGELPSDSRWQPLSYQFIVEIIEQLLEDNKERLPDSEKNLIQNYIEIIRRDVMEDKELNDICNKIYENHRKALDLIYSHSNMGKNPTQIAIKEALSELEREGLIKYDPKVHDTFYTARMTAFLPDISEPKSAWRNEHLYRYWFERNDETITLVFDISHKGADESSKAKLNAFFETRSSRKKEKSDTYNRVHTLGKKIDLAELESSKKKEKIVDMVKKLIDEKERDWIRKCEEQLNMHPNDK